MLQKNWRGRGNRFGQRHNFGAICSAAIGQHKVPLLAAAAGQHKVAAGAVTAAEDVAVVLRAVDAVRDSLRSLADHDVIAVHDSLVAGHDSLVAGHDSLVGGHDSLVATQHGDLLGQQKARLPSNDNLQ